MRGKTISIYIQDKENPKSIKICDIKSSIAKAIFIPRNQLQQAFEYNKKELQNPGIYFLFGEDDNEDIRAYIGEAEILIDRIKQHNQSKDFWNSAICFISEKGNINKAHIKYLENFAYNEAKRINKCILENSTNPTQSSLEKQDEDFILDFFDDLKIIISVLGYPIFDENQKNQKNILYCRGKLAEAFGEYVEDGFIVFRGSKSNIEETKSLSKAIRNMRINLLQKNIIKKEGNVFIFQNDYKFNSLSTASDVILGRSSNGWMKWKNKEGITIDKIIRK